MQEPIEVIPERTPNPHSMKFVINRLLLDDPINFEDSKNADRSPLASKLFGFPWTSAVYIGRDFITITKQDWVEWEMLAEPLAGMLREHFDSGEAVLTQRDPNAEVQTDYSDDDSTEVREIKRLIIEEIRPAVAMDGGDIVFHKYEDNRVYIYMKGACSGCPSSTMTLKQGIEVRMKEVLPQIIEVIAL